MNKNLIAKSKMKKEINYNAVNFLKFPISGGIFPDIIFFERYLHIIENLLTKK